MAGSEDHTVRLTELAQFPTGTDSDSEGSVVMRGANGTQNGSSAFVPGFQLDSPVFSVSWHEEQVSHCVCMSVVSVMPVMSVCVCLCVCYVCYVCLCLSVCVSVCRSARWLTPNAVLLATGADLWVRVRAAGAALGCD